jgi:hypothetical protein
MPRPAIALPGSQRADTLEGMREHRVAAPTAGRRRASTPPGRADGRSQAFVSYLQHTAGNAAVARLLSGWQPANGPSATLQRQWRDGTKTLSSLGAVVRYADVPADAIHPSSEAGTTLTSGDLFHVAPKARLQTQILGGSDVRVLPDGKHAVGETKHGDAAWDAATAPWSYVPKMRERYKTYDKPGEERIAGADTPLEAELGGKNRKAGDLALEGHNEYALSALTLAHQLLTGYDQTAGSKASHKDYYDLLFERLGEAYFVLLRLRGIGIALADSEHRSSREAAYLDLAVHIDVHAGFSLLRDLLKDRKLVEELGGFKEKIWSKRIKEFQDLFDLAVKRIVEIDKTPQAKTVTAMTATRERDQEGWNKGVSAAITGKATRDPRELEMTRRINAGPSPLLAQVGKAHIPGLRAKGVAATTHDDEPAFVIATTSAIKDPRYEAALREHAEDIAVGRELAGMYGWSEPTVLEMALRGDFRDTVESRRHRGPSPSYIA